MMNKATLEILAGYKKIELPKPGNPGRLAQVTDDVRGIWIDQGHHWFSLNGNAINVMEFGAKGDGKTDDSLAFCDAFTSGDRILIPSGMTFLIGDIKVTNQTLFGGGTIRKKSDSPWAFHIIGDGAVINGLRFYAEHTSGQPNADIRLGDGARNVRIINCCFESSTYSAVAGAGWNEPEYKNHVSGVIFSNNIVKGKYARPLYLYSIDHITIKGNIIRDCQFDAIRLVDNDGFCLIDGNQFINIGDPCWPDEQTRDAVDCYWSGDHIVISNNIINTGAAHGLDIKGFAKDGSHGSRKIVVCNNQIYGTRYSGINISGDSDYDEQGSFKSIDGVIVSGNIIEGCNQNNRDGTGNMGDAAIHCRGLCSYLAISQNYVVSNFSRGIFINSIPDKAISKSIMVNNNLCVNNGYKDHTDGVGIIIFAVDGLIVTNNICENDPNLPNPNQTIGLQITSSSSGYSTLKSIIVRDNICRNNLRYQIVTESNNTRADGIAVFEGNIQEGNNAIQRKSWHDQRSVFFGAGIPGPGDGRFRRGDLIFNVNVSAGGSVGWICIKDGNPGTWKKFGSVEA